MDNTTITPSNEERPIEVKATQGHPSVAKIVLVSVLVSSLFGFLSGVAATRFSFVGTFDEKKLGDMFRGGDTKSAPTSAKVPLTMVEEDNAVVSVVEAGEKSVVSIVITKDVPVYRDMFGSPFGFFFGQPDEYSQEENGTRRKVGGGTGFFATSDGMIVTNKHVVEDASAQYTVLLSDGSEHDAKVLARDPVRDIAIIKIEGGDFPVLELGDSDALKVGQTVIAIGNSLGEFSNSVSRGIVSGLARDIVAGSGAGGSERLNNIIQTDAAINPGNSGGPLLDIHGKVIGVNTAVATGAENVGFALPINSIKRTIDQVKKNGKISTPFIGVRYIPVNKKIQDANGLSVDYGALVLRGQNMADLAVLPGSPADKAGIVENDIILEINGKKIDEKNPLDLLISGYNVGDTLTLKVLHRAEEKTVSLTLEERKTR